MTVVLNGSLAFPSGRQALSGIGKYFTVTNPTIGTPVVGTNLTSWSATANGLFLIRNTSTGSGPTIYVDRFYLRERATAPTGTLVMNFEAYNETGQVTGTGNVTTRTPIQPNQSLAQTTVAQVQAFAAGAITIPAAVGTRVLQDTASISTGAAADGDVYVIQCGQDGSASSKAGLTAVRSTSDTARIVGDMGPILVAPNTTTWFNMWWITAGANTPSWEYGFSYFEQ